MTARDAGTIPAPALPADDFPPEDGFPGTVERIAQTGRTTPGILRTLIERDLHPVPGHPRYYYGETLGAQAVYRKGEKKDEQPASGDVPADSEETSAAVRGPSWSLVLPRIPIVTENYVELDDSGEVVRQYFTLAAGRDTARTVNLADLRTGEAWNKLPDLVGTGSRTMRDLLVSIVTDQAERVPRMYAVARTGMHTIGGQRTYVYPDGRTYPAGPSVHVIGVSSELSAAAAPPDREATDREIRTALEGIASHGWQPLFALGIGARSFAYTTRPVAGGAGIWGDMGSGKTLSAGIARKLILSCGYAPVATAAFSDTATDMECKVAVEADMPILIDDLALTAESSTIEIDDGRRKLEMLFRAAGNNRAMRGRRRRDLTAAEERRLGSIPMVTAQQMPRTMQASLYRRTILAPITKGDVDTAWYLANTKPDGTPRTPAWDALDRPLRTLGARIIRHLVDLGDGAGPWLDQLAADARALVGPPLDRVLTTIPAELETVITVACGSVTGLLMLAEVSGVSRETLTGPALDPIAASIARQGDVMTDRQDTADNLATAISDVVRAALLSRRAHLRNRNGVIEPCVPDQTEQAQGVSKIPGSGEFARAAEWNGAGVAFYYEPGTDVLKVRATELHSLCAVSPDQRVKGYSVQTLPSALLRAGAVLPSTQKGSPAVTIERIPGVDKRPRMVHLRGDVIWRTGDQDTPPMPAAATPEPDAPAPAPAGPVDQVTPFVTEHRDLIRNARTADDLAAIDWTEFRDAVDVDLIDGDTLTELREAYSLRMRELTPPAPAGPEEPPAPIPAQSRAARSTSTRTKGQTKTDRPAAARVPAAVGVDLVDGALVSDPFEIPETVRDVASLMDWTAGLDIGPEKTGTPWWRHDGLVYLSGPAAEYLGLPKTAPNRPNNRGANALRKAGWTLSSREGDSGLSSYAAMWKGNGPDKTSRRLIVLSWLEQERPSAPEITVMDPSDPMPAGTAARRQNQFDALHGIPMGFTGAVTGRDKLRALRPTQLPTKGEDGRYELAEDGTKVMHQAPFGLQTIEIPRPILHDLHPRAAGRTRAETCFEEDYVWTRGGDPRKPALSDAETAMGYAVALDTMTSFASVLERLIVPLGDYEHRTSPLELRKGMIGLGYADLSQVETEPDLPHFATPDGQRPTGPGWYSIRTLAYAVSEYGWHGRMDQSYVVDRSGALFEPWWPPIRAAYLDLMARCGVTKNLTGQDFLTAYAGYKSTGTADDLALLTWTKSLYKSLVGKFREGPRTADHREWLDRVVTSPWWRPDVRGEVLSASRLGTHRRVRKTHRLTGRAPFAAFHDGLAYTSPEPSPLSLIPTGIDPETGKPVSGAIRLGVGPGSMKLEGVAPLVDVLSLCATGAGVNAAAIVAHYSDGEENEHGQEEA